MCHTAGGRHQCIQRLRIRFRSHQKIFRFSDADAEADICSLAQISGEFSGFFNEFDTLIIVHHIFLIRHQHCQFVCHDGTHNTVKIFFQTVPDLLIMLLHSDTASHRICHVVSLLFISAYHSNHVGILQRDS